MKKLLILLSLSGVSFLIYQYLVKKPVTEPAPDPAIKVPPDVKLNVSEYDRNLEFNAKYIYSVLISEGLNAITIAKYATAMAAHETGGFTSNIYRINKNAYGYKYVGQRLATGENRGHAMYRTVKDSVIEFVEYWNRRRSRLPMPIFSLSGFVSYLKNPNIKPGSYFEASEAEYYRGCRHFYNKLFP